MKYRKDQTAVWQLKNPSEQNQGLNYIEFFTFRCLLPHVSLESVEMHNVSIYSPSVFVDEEILLVKNPYRYNILGGKHVQKKCFQERTN